MKKFCGFLREQTMKIINFEEKNNGIINKRTAEIMKMQKFVMFVKKNLKINMTKTIVIIQANIEVMDIEFVI